MAPVSRNFIVDLGLPIFIFPALAVIAFNIVFDHLHVSGSGAVLSAECSAGISSGKLYRLSYTGVDFVDANLCTMVTFFQPLIDPSNLTYLAEAFVAITPMVIFPFVEAARNGRSLLVATPALFGVIFQLFSLAFISPIYCFIFILSGGANLHFPQKPSKRGNGPTAVDHDGSARVTKSHAEGIVFGLFVGYIIPSVCMVILRDPYVTAIWQGFPVWISLAGFAHRFFRRHQQSGHNIIRGLYIFLFALSALVHAKFIWPLILNDWETLQALFVPSVAIAKSTMEQGVFGFIQWDLVLTLASTVLMTLWFPTNIQEFVSLVAWYPVATVLFGPGAAIAGVFVWREEMLNGGKAADVDSEVSKKNE